MKCPRCKMVYETINDNGKLVAHKVAVCYFCGFVFKTDPQEKFTERCAEKIMRHITDFKRTKNPEHARKADAYFQVLLPSLLKSIFHR